ncbi:CBS domain-containing protein (plasmid) [Pseudomonas sp. BYT-5]|uniref:CBS domain-containing protein n=1 Tax=unclassified Pseudomonas TaxID=196821 RepID=UPI0020205D14|nr:MULTISPECIES: CBS domain-containing protein [unclassified Pseudomonas]URD45504.1 CBS domain-containing protein [Pseudomonas sp. BYT-5]URL00877.1 CBS domain-containing protein [Pseudomonas sp. BYT-1]
MRTIAQTLAGKPQSLIYSIHPESSVFEAIRRMAEKDVGALIVQEGERLVGIVSERDYARKMVLCGRASAATPVSIIMSSPVVTVSPSETIQHCLQLMSRGHMRHLPVVEAGRVIGMVSIGDLVKDIITEQAELIDHLQKYIRGE